MDLSFPYVLKSNETRLFQNTDILLSNTLSHPHDNDAMARFLTLMKNIIDIMFRQLAFNLHVTIRLKKEVKILEKIPCR